MIPLTNPQTEWSSYETKAALLLHERRAEELQLERLKIRLQSKMQAAAVRDREATAA
jgi:hypothetical protein